MQWCVNGFFFYFSDVDLANTYQGAEAKSLIVVGFISKAQIPFHFLLGDGSYVFLPNGDDPVRFFEKSSFKIHPNYIN